MNDKGRLEAGEGMEGAGKGCRRCCCIAVFVVDCCFVLQRLCDNPSFTAIVFSEIVLCSVNRNTSFSAMVFSKTLL